MAIQQILASLGGSSTDPNYANVQSLLHLNGTNGSTTYTDEKGRTWTTQATAPTISTSISKFGGASLDFGSAAGNLQTAYDTGLQFTGDFTVEFWHYLRSKVSSFPSLFGNYGTFTTNGGINLFAGHNSGDTNKYNFGVNGTFISAFSSSNIIYNQWVAIAVVRSGSTISLYVDGVLEGTTTFGGTVTGTGNFWWLGASGVSTNSTRINGLIDEWRVTKGVARYTANYTPQTAEFPNF